MKRSLVIVESPAKARTISRFLGAGFQVEASMGHVRDLPSTAAEIPARVKDQPWARVGVDVEHDFAPVYIVPAKKRTQVKKLKDLAKGADELYLATDEDREGEAIAWHLLEVLQPDVPVKRMVFHEITRPAIEEALQNPRGLDHQLVDAQEARRILDRLYGYEVSPVLWRKVQSGLSAGRVQSVAVRLVVDRERARMRFVKAGFWDVDGILATREPKEKVAAHLTELGGKRVATGKDFHPETGALNNPDAVRLIDEAQARRVAVALRTAVFTVATVTEKPFVERPYPPFITSTMQQEAARKLRFGAQRTMRIAQSLYENGYITYMRTDSTTLSQQAITAARNLVAERYGAHFLPESPRVYAKKVKGAQEAHEAIRPAGAVFRTPDELRGELDGDALRLYELIWKRTVASQMKDATGKRTNVTFTADADGERATFTASGKVITFPGFWRAYVEGSDDPESELEDQERVLPALREGQELDAVSMEAKGHETQPPARYTEASLIKELEERGIGRPSTYASIIQTILDREYVWKKSTALVPTFTAFAVVNLLERHFGELVDYDFTAHMEEDLDLIASGERQATPWLKEFYFGTGHATNGNGHTILNEGLKKRIGTGWEEIDPRSITSIPLGHDEDGHEIVVRVGRYGPYLQQGDDGPRANVPADLPPDELSTEMVHRILERSKLSDRALGTDPETGKPIYLKVGRFGPYVQLGNMEDGVANGERNDGAGLERNADGAGLERNADGAGHERNADGAGHGRNADGAGHGRNADGAGHERNADGAGHVSVRVKKGPSGNGKKKAKTAAPKPKMASLWPGMTPESLTLDQARLLLSFPRTIGAHPTTGEPITAQDGRFGPYLKMGTETRSLPNHQALATVTVDEAVGIFAQPKARRGQTRRGALAEVGAHPKTGAPLKVMPGRFGAYVTDGTLNASLPKGKAPTSLTIAEAVELLEARAQKLLAMGKDPLAAKPARPRRAAAAKKSASAPPTRKKAASGRSATK